MTHNTVPLCVDLDGTLLFNNAQTQDFYHMISQKPSLFVQSWRTLIGQGKTALLDFLTAYRLPATSRLFNPLTLHFIQWRKKSGQHVYLVTGSHQKIADDIGQHLGLFEGVFGSSDGVHLIRNNKASFLKQTFGVFDYLGNSWQDLPVWNLAREKWVINPDSGLVWYLPFLIREDFQNVF